MAKYPLAIWKSFPGIGSYRDGPFKIVHHTTEGSSAAGAIATYGKTGSYPHFTVEDDVVYQHVDTDVAVTALEHPAGTPETNRSHAIQIEFVGFAGQPKSFTGLETLSALCRWLEQQHGIPREWPNGYPKPAVNGHDPGGHNRNVTTWQTQGGHYGHCHVPNNHHWDPGYTAEEVTIVLGDPQPATVAAADLNVEKEAFPSMGFVDDRVGAQPTSASDYIQKLVRITEGEYDAYHGITETDEPLRSRIDVYCHEIGIAPPPDITAFPWSATFISWCIKKAGATRSEFAFSPAHAVFVQAAIANADARRGVFRARPVADYGPRSGDLIHRNRSGGTITYAQARTRSDYPSHSAIVVEIGEDQLGRFAITIGGNESDSIRRTRIALGPDGKVVQKSTDPFICVVQDLKIDAGARDEASPAATNVAPSADRRRQMAQIIVDYEARRDRQHRLAVYFLPPGDGGGRYEVAGINERFNKTLCDELVALIQNEQQEEAERRAVAFIAEDTDITAEWTSNPAVEFYLRDCVFNRGTRGGAWILQRAVGVATDQIVGPVTRAAVVRDEARPLALLDSLRQARETYERLRRDETSIFWTGLVNRWNNALAAARSFLPESAVQDVMAREPDTAAGPQSAFEPPPDPAWLPADPAAPRFEAPAESLIQREAVAAAPVVIASSSAVTDDLMQLHQHLERALFARPAVGAIRAESISPSDVSQMIVGVGIGPAHRDFESVGPAGPGAPVLNIYVTEAMSMEAVKAILVDKFAMPALASDRQPVNVIRSGPIDALMHRDRVRPSPCGISVAHYKVTAGTQGVLALGRAGARRSRLLMLSNNHVLANENDCQAGDAIMQPGSYDLPNSPESQVAVLERWVPLDFSDGGENYVDCATGWCWPDRVRKEFIYRKGGEWAYFAVAAQPAAATVGMSVGKSGRTTQLTSGRVIDVSASIRVNYSGGRSANFRDQITIRGNDGKPFSQSGDSGSLIWTWEEARKPIGLLFAGGPELTFANKLSHVLDALDLTLFT